MAEKVGGIYYEVDLDTRKMVEGQRRASRELDGLSTKLTATAAAVAVMAAALATLKIAKLADEILLLSTRVEVAAGSVESGTAAFSALVDISRRTQSSLAGNIEVFNRLNQSILQMGGTQQDTLQLTELLAKAIKVSGASAVEAKSAMLQFGQALGSGKLAGDELRSLLETAPYLMRQLADGIGVPVGALKKLGEEGKLTADVVTAALTKAAAQIDADFRKFPQTIEAAMVVAQDQAALAALKFDELNGSSATLTGVIKGVGEVLDKLALQFGAANTEAGNLGRNQAISTWSEKTRTVLSYVVDAADLAWQTLSVLGRNVAFVFQGVGSEIGGIGAQIAAVMRGDFAGAKAIGDAMKADAEQRRRDLDAKDAETLRDRKLAGQQMREAWEQGAGGGRGFVNPTPDPSKLKAPGGGDGKPKKPPRDYFNEEQDKLEERLRLGYDRIADSEVDAIEKARKKVEDEQKRGRDFALGLSVEGDPLAKLQVELQAKSDLLAEYAALDQENAELYAQAKLALEQNTAERMREIVENEQKKKAAAEAQALQNYALLFANMGDVVKAFGGEQSRAYKAIFAVSKAFSIAQSIIAIQSGIAMAANGPFPLNIGAMATVAAQTAGIISTIQGTNFGGGRQYGGPATAGTMYRVNETGRPEMFTAANGAQYMMPTTNGNVTPANEVGSGAGAAVIELRVINQVPGVGVSQRTGADGRPELVIAEVARQISENSGPVWSAMRSSTNIQGRMG
jgi:tape measure domain-containing protein